MAKQKLVTVGMIHTKGKIVKKGNDRAVFTCLGASNHALEDRENDDYYATEPKAAELLLEVEPELNNIWECACGAGHLAEVFRKAGKLKLATDIVNRGYGDGIRDFLDKNIGGYSGDIVTNPPYKYAEELLCERLDSKVRVKLYQTAAKSVCF